MMPLTLVCAMLCVSACVAWCPPRCECSDAPRTVRCASAALHRVPAAIPRDASSLIITGNAIPRLDPSAFSGPQNATLLNRYEIDSDPRLGHVSHGQQGRPRMDPRLAHISTDARITQIPSDVTL